MWNLVNIAIILLFVDITFVMSDNTDSIQKPTVTRTQLRVSKSLNPDDMQELNVRSNNGGYATILVKKRDGKSTNIPPEAELFNFERKSNQTNAPLLLTKIEQKTDKWIPIQKVEKSYQFASSPFTFAQPEDEHSINLINSFVKHISQIDSNPRSYNVAPETAIKNDRSPVHIAVASSHVLNDPRVPAPVQISSEPVFVKEKPGSSTMKRGRSIMSIGFDGIPVVHGVRVPDDDQDHRKIWRNARVINGELVPYEKGYVPKKAEPIGLGQLVFVKKDPQNFRFNNKKGIGPFTASDNFSSDESGRSFGPFTVEDNLRSPSEKVETRFKFPGQSSEPKSSNEGSVGPFTIIDNAKMANAKLIAYIKKINEKESRRDYFAGRSSKFFEDDSASPQIQRRMLQYPGHTVYPSSSLYSTDITKRATEKLTDGTRMPVLEYAHPELGVQPASAMPSDYEPKQKSKKVQYYAKDYHHTDHSPYSHNDYMLEQPETYSSYDGDKFNKKLYEKYSLKNSATYPYNYGYLRKVKEQPFYMKFAEQMRDSFQNSFASVQEITRPVIDPLVEAGQKISKNLGFTVRGNNDEAQDKSGIITAAATGISSPSTIIPAIGLVAGGAALGLGAMAVGRIFEGNLLRRSADGTLILDENEKRALDAIQNGQDLYVVMEQPEQDTKRLRRSINDFETYSENSQDHLIRVKRNKFDQQNKNDKFDGQQTEFVEFIDFTGEPSSIDEIIHMARSVSNDNDIKSIQLKEHSISKRSIVGNDEDSETVGDVLQDIEKSLSDKMSNTFEDQVRKTDWNNTPCAKKTFCEVMLMQTSDDLVLMEKKMDTLLNMMHPSVKDSISEHLHDVTAAIHQRDCSPFICKRY